MKRIPALDSLRGLLLLLMTFNHLIWISGGTTALQRFTLQPFGQFGAAEGFVFISGLLAGAIYSRRELSDRETQRKAHRRALTIYSYHLVCLAIIVVWFALAYVYSPLAHGVLRANVSGLESAPIPALMLSVLLINKPFYLDILPLYVMFMILLPLLIAAYRRGLMWLAVSVSAACWSMSGWVTDAMLAPLYTWVAPELTVQTGFFDPVAWQLLFVLSSALGFACQNRSFKWRYPALTGLCAVVAAFIMAAQTGLLWEFGFKPQTLYMLGNKPELAWIRLVSLGVWVYLIAVVIQSYPQALTWRPLSYLGRYSLQVFSFQAVLIYLCAPLLFSLRVAPAYLPVVALCCASLWLPAWFLAARQRGALSGASTSPESAKPVLMNRLKAGGVIGGVCAVLVAINVLSGTLKGESDSILSGEAGGQYPLTIQVNGARDVNEFVVVSVFAESDDLNGTASVHKQTYTKLQVSEGIVLDALPVGQYAVFAYQDSDGNQSLTMDSSGMPQEAMGYSNNPMLMGPPTMKQVRFAHHKPQTQTVNLTQY
ncbi:OpgC domain-containing protein [Photobacterium nomapromontoriensis]|uniref:OpgC domain-containing protein n=1 Tax=Photobacterium nomapromontoriensis TaxID=2910237 RepID=UPI003D09A59B